MPIYQYKDKEGKIVEKLVKFNLRDKQEGLTRIPTYPSQIRTKANSDSHADGRLQRDPHMKQALEIAKMEEAAGNERHDKRDEIYKDIEEMKKDVF